VATFAPGVTFGELAVLEERTRTTRACCDHDVIVWTLSSAALERIASENPPLAASVYRVEPQSFGAVAGDHARAARPRRS
jgi:CRP-like cAMP-binding protein